MKTIPLRKQNQALTLLETLIVMAVIAVLLTLATVGLSRAKTRAYRLPCVNNLKQSGLAFIVWSSDNNDKFPMAVARTNGGSVEFTTGPNAFRHFQVMSNELSTPKVMTCPSELDKIRSATNFTDINNLNLSFFVGIDASKTNSQMILAGDRNITNNAAPQNGLLELTTNQSTGWTAEMHNKVGNVALADGSVQMVSIPGVRDLVAKTGFATNRIQLPIRTP